MQYALHQSKHTFSIHNTVHTKNVCFLKKTIFFRKCIFFMISKNSYFHLTLLHITRSHRTCFYVNNAWFTICTWTQYIIFNVVLSDDVTRFVNKLFSRHLLILWRKRLYFILAYPAVKLSFHFDLDRRRRLNLCNTSWKARRCPWKKKLKERIKKKNFLDFFSLYHPRPPLSVQKKIQPNRSSRLAGYRLHIYKCLVLLYRLFVFFGYLVTCSWDRE